MGLVAGGLATKFQEGDMKNKIKFTLASVVFLVIIVASVGVCVGCYVEEPSEYQNITDTRSIAEKLTGNQQTPVDIEYSLERYNLIKRAYWVNGMREKAAALPCEVTKPIGYLYCLSYGKVVAEFTVDGKISSLRSYLSPDSEYYEYSGSENHWLSDIDGSYGDNSDGIFFFTIDGLYVEWKGEYLYTDIPLNTSDTLLFTEE